jgi:dolichol-phosphate mannosyltransferase
MATLSHSTNDSVYLGARILVFIPMYNCANQIGRVIAQFNAQVQQHFTKIVIVDNRSTDQGLEAVERVIGQLRLIDVDVLRNVENYGLGGSHKVAFACAIDQDFDYVVVLHGDDQGTISDLIPHLEQLNHQRADCLLGARFMPGSRLTGYSPFRRIGNHAFNLIYSIAAGRRLYDLGSGLNLYSVAALRDRAWLTFPDDLTFNYYMILASAAKNWHMRFFPLTWREEDQRSNVKLVRQAWKVLAIVLSCLLRPKQFLTADWRAQPGRNYQAETIMTRQASGSTVMELIP